ncbi:YceI family protein [Paracoccus sp. DMF-8]|uniref:YceI family protein n=1 Tax=Paracoccus sp. DMF-8 TaxID=3019445 RepID=UPI0023E75C60|nr:YceI family protein [Paracoccus sp. DMF-8]MDF3607087.1 YceI family protein [Paracoccus sp. DMF-8]
MRRALSWALMLCATPLVAQVAAQDIAPDDVPRGVPDYHAAEAGTYRLDPTHTAVIARVPHMNFSISVFRFDVVSGQLEWNPQDLGAVRLVADVDPASISTPVPGFAEALRGTDYLDTASHPTARFVADGFVADSPVQGRISGQLTIMGQTHPATFDATLIGAGQGYTGDENGNPIIRNLIGLSAETAIDPQQFGLNPFFTDPVVIQIDAEFARQD